MAVALAIRLDVGWAYLPAVTKLTQSPWFLNFGVWKAFQPSFLHWSLLVGVVGSVGGGEKSSALASVFDPSHPPATSTLPFARSATIPPRPPFRTSRLPPIRTPAPGPPVRASVDGRPRLD